MIFTSDNGGADYVGLPDLNQPVPRLEDDVLRGRRAHAVLRELAGAARRAGQRFDAPVAHVDIFATAAARGRRAAADGPPDRRRRPRAVRARRARRAAPHARVFWRSGHYRTVRAGDWKLQVSERPPRTWLFDLANDPTEQRDLAGERPDKVAELRAMLDAHDGADGRAGVAVADRGRRSRSTIRSTCPTQPDDEYVYWAN